MEVERVVLEEELFEVVEVGERVVIWCVMLLVVAEAAVEYSAHFGGVVFGFDEDVSCWWLLCYGGAVVVEKLLNHVPERWYVLLRSWRWAYVSLLRGLL